MRVIHTAGTTVPRGEQTVVNALSAAPGYLLANVLATSKKRTREVDLVAVHGTGVTSLEVKATLKPGTLVTVENGPWTINGTPVDFVGGPNPLAQARSGAASMRGHIERETGVVTFIPAIVVVVGNATVEPHKRGDVWVCTPEQVAGVLMRQTPQRITSEQAASIVAAFGHTEPADSALAKEGFAQSQHPVTPAAATLSAAERKVLVRKEDMDNTAETMWRQSHLRSVVASGIVSILALIYTLIISSPTAFAGGTTLACIVGLYQVSLRVRIPGPRLDGPQDVLVWLVSLGPYFAIGATLTLPLADAAPGETANLIQWYVAALFIILILATTLMGRNAFIYPPNVVVEKLGRNGKPTGFFILASPDSRRKRYRVRMLDPNDPRVKVLTDDQLAPPQGGPDLR